MSNFVSEGIANRLAIFQNKANNSTNPPALEKVDTPRPLAKPVVGHQTNPQPSSTFKKPSLPPRQPKSRESAVTVSSNAAKVSSSLKSSNNNATSPNTLPTTPRRDAKPLSSKTLPDVPSSTAAKSSTNNASTSSNSKSISPRDVESLSKTTVSSASKLSLPLKSTINTTNVSPNALPPTSPREGKPLSPKASSPDVSPNSSPREGIVSSFLNTFWTRSNSTPSQSSPREVIASNSHNSPTPPEKTKQNSPSSEIQITSPSIQSRKQSLFGNQDSTQPKELPKKPKRSPPAAKEIPQISIKPSTPDDDSIRFKKHNRQSTIIRSEHTLIPHVLKDSSQEITASSSSDILVVRQTLQRKPMRDKMVKTFMHHVQDSEGRDVYSGLKARIRDSLLIDFQGDYLNLKSNPKFKEIAKNHDMEFDVSNTMTKINKRYRTQTRKVVVTPNYIYTMDEERMKFNRMIPITQVNGISVSSMRDAFVVMHCTDVHDLLASCKKKTELITVICNAYRDKSSVDLPVHVTDKITYKPSKESKDVKSIEFKNDSTVKAPILTPCKNGCVISVNNMDKLRVKQEIPNSKKQKNITSTLEMLQTADERGLKDKTNSIYEGRKARNRKTIMKEYLGDYLRWDGTHKLKTLFERNGDNELVFSGKVVKYNKNFKKQQRLILITDKNVYNMEEQDYKIKRKIPLEEISGVSVSPFDDHMFLIHCPTGDYLLEDDKKTEIIAALQQSILRSHGKEMSIKVDDQFHFIPQSGNMALPVSFLLEDDTNKETWTENRNHSLVVHVKRKEQSVVLEAAYVYVNDETMPIEVKSRPILIKLKKRWTYKLQIRFYINEYLASCEFHEKIDTISNRVQYISKVAELEPKEERYVITLPERPVTWSLLSKTRVKCKLVDSTGKVLMAVRFVYDIH